MKTTQELLKLLKEYKQTRGEFYGISAFCIFGSVVRFWQNVDALLKHDIMEEGIYV